MGSMQGGQDILITSADKFIVYPSPKTENIRIDYKL